MGSYISAKIIKHNNTLNFNYDLGVPRIGVIGIVPTPVAGAEIEGDYWCVPVDDNGILSGADFIPCSPTDEVAPTPNSFHVVLITSGHFRGRENFWILGRSTYVGTGSPIEYGYVQAANDAECCVAVPRQMPTTTLNLSPCILMCQYADGTTNYFANWGLPTLVGNQRYYPRGHFNGGVGTTRGATLASQTSTGYATTGTLLTYLNGSTFSTYGTFAYANNQLTFTQAPGPGTDYICLTIDVVNPSA